MVYDSDEYRAFRADLVRYCLAQELEDFLVTVTEFDWVFIIGKSKGNFGKAVELVKAEAAL